MKDKFKEEFIPQTLPKDWEIVVEPYQSQQVAAQGAAQGNSQGLPPGASQAQVAGQAQMQNQAQFQNQASSLDKGKHKVGLKVKVKDLLKCKFPTKATGPHNLRIDNRFVSLLCVQ